MLLDDLNILNLLRKIQESTTQDVDEEKGSFKVGDRVIYNMYETGLTNSDLIRMLGANEHASRVNHHEKEVKILEAEGDKVACYKVQFDDGFVINGVSVSELKSISEESKTNEAAEVPQTMQPQEKPNINAEDYHMEDYSEEDLEKVKSKSAETGNAIRQVEDDELKQEPGKAKKESITNKAATPEDNIISVYKEARRNGKSREEATQIAAKTSKGQADSVAVRKLLDIRGVRESTSTFTKQKPLWLCNSCFKTFRSDENICSCKSTNTEKITEGEGWAVGHLKNAYDIKFEVTGKKDSIRVEAFDEPDAKKLVQRIKPGAKVLDVTKVQEDKIPGGLADRSKPEDFDKEQLDAGTEVEMEHTKDLKLAQEIAMDHLAEDPDYYKKLKKMEAGKDNSRPIESKVVEKKFIVCLTAGGRGEELSVVAEDEEDAKLQAMQAWPDVVIHSVVEEGKISQEKKITETVKELIGETPGISVEDQKILNWAMDNKVIDPEFPDDDVMFDALSIVFEDPMMKRKLKDVHNLGAIDKADWDSYYLKYVMLPKAREAYAKMAELKTNEQKEDWDLTFKYDHDILTGNPLLDKEGNPYLWEKHSIEGRKIRVFTDYQAGWVEGKGATPVREAKVQEQEEEPIDEIVDDIKDTYTTVARGIVDKADADKLARDKKGVVVADEEDPKKFMIIVKEAVEEEYKPKVMRSKMIDVMYDLGYHLAGERKEEEARVLEFRKGDNVIEIKLALEEEKD